MLGGAVSLGNIAQTGRMGTFVSQEVYTTLKHKGRKDVLVCGVLDHGLMTDGRQAILQHPKTCTLRGAPADRYKTFHPWHDFVERTEQCCSFLPEPLRTPISNYVKELSTYRMSRE